MRSDDLTHALAVSAFSTNRVSFASGLEPLYELLQAKQIQGMVIEPFDYPALDEKKIRAQRSPKERSGTLSPVSRNQVSRAWVRRSPPCANREK